MTERNKLMNEFQPIRKSTMTIIRIMTRVFFLVCLPLHVFKSFYAVGYCKKLSYDTGVCTSLTYK